MAKQPKTRSPIKDRATREAVWRYLDRIWRDGIRDANAATDDDDANAYRFGRAVGQINTTERIIDYLCGDIEREGGGE